MSRAPDSTLADPQQIIANLRRERDEALAREAATAEVLQVINSSPGDLAPVFEAMLEKAVRLCGAATGVLRTFDGESLPLAAVHGEPEVVARMKELDSVPPRGTKGDLLGRIVNGERIVHVPDVRETKVYRDFPPARERLEALGIRTWLGVGLHKDDELQGVIIAQRGEVRPFSAREIALLENFAAQAVIAIENARLITETREALEQQTATAEVLQVINSSPGDLAPVFDAMLEKATSLCAGVQGALWTITGESVRLAATYGLPDEFVELIRQQERPEIGPNALLQQIMRGERVVHVLDLEQHDLYKTGEPLAKAAFERGRIRTLIWVALVKEGAPVGAFAIARREIRPFSDKQIALLQNFAAQAVIAMENARLITETREALEQQTATAEVLQVINSSPGDLAPVFEAILQKAHSLCGAAHGTLMTYDGEYARAVATQGVAEPLAGLLREPFRPLSTSPLARLVREHCVIHIPDQTAEAQWGPNDPKRIATAKEDVRTMLFVPLRKDETVIGWIAANRLEVRPFSGKEIALLESFAAQAVIAMDNARLLDEIRQRQAELRVTFDNMGDGVAMFDAELRLAAWNLNFQRIVDLPDTFAESRPSYQDYARYLAERGEYGVVDVEAEVCRLSRLVGAQGSLERTRPDGRVIEVRYNAGARAAGIEDGASEPVTRSEDGGARPADRRHRPRNQEPVELRSVTWITASRRSNWYRRT
jgi:GAF domain-containing protein